MNSKFDELKKYLNHLKEQGLCLAFSGGIDSTLLLYLCREMGILAITFNSNFQTAEEIELSKNLCQKYGVRQIIIEKDVFENPIILDNPKDRCYHCKKFLFENAVKIAKDNGFGYIADGTNFDDLNVYRPGRKALKELGIISPFAMFEITKQEIRDYAKNCGIEIYSKPSSPCLATRFPYGTKLTKEKLAIVEKGEDFLKKEGFDCCRLRLHDNIARIEVLPEKFAELLNKKDLIIAELKNLGISYITLDLEGFRSGSMDLNL